MQGYNLIKQYQYRIEQQMYQVEIQKIRPIWLHLKF